MNETGSLLLAMVTGTALGAIFFGGLWWTVRKSFSSHQPALWFLSSVLLRTCLVLAGFYCVARGHWERLALCLVGFVAARLIVTRLTREAEEPSSWKPEASRAP
jgi:F1F0 ATPase subunit 2